ncbi:hypothetical protein HZS_436 [Henneguya salminicola]|nr:hypothetical protein HZS_436 [Henneguya salminicola]
MKNISVSFSNQIPSKYAVYASIREISKNPKLDSARGYIRLILSNHDSTPNETLNFNILLRILIGLPGKLFIISTHILLLWFSIKELGNVSNVCMNSGLLKMNTCTVSFFLYLHVDRIELDAKVPTNRFQIIAHAGHQRRIFRN